MPMIAANMFWLENLRDYNIDHSLSLPFDRYRLSNEHRTGRGISLSFHLSQHFSNHFLSYTILNNIKSHHLALAIYYVFLFKLTNGENDLCIGMNIDNRYKNEFKSIIGLFENIIPLRCQLNPHCSFNQLIKHVYEVISNAMQYSYFPLQRILNQYSNVSQYSFLHTLFQFQSNQKLIDDHQLYAMPFSNKMNENEVIIKSDFNILIQHNVDMNQFSYTIDASLDLFHFETLEKITQRFHSMLEQIFISTNEQINTPLFEFSIILSDENLIMKSLNNTQVLFPPSTCIHHEFVYQVMKHPQKLAVELDEQSLTYSELLHYVQILSLNLLNVHRVNPGEIICQCVERSLSMVS